MHINVITLFPEFFESPLNCSLLKKAQDAGILSFSLYNPRTESLDKHHNVDDRPYGGGPGMVMLPQPLAATLRRIGFSEGGSSQPGRLLYLSPRGIPFSQKIARELATLSSYSEEAVHSNTTPECTGAIPSITLICGRYEGIDARLEEIFPVECLSVGDFVLNGGEAAALCVIEAVGRLLPGFMGHEESGEDESFSTSLLEYSHFTRPEIFENKAVPEVLLSGNHAKIKYWRRENSLACTLDKRPDLLADAPLDNADRLFLKQINRSRLGKNLYSALIHYPVLDKEGNSIAVSLTNLDIHDIARSSCTYGLAGHYVVTPLEDQREIFKDIVKHWTKGPGAASNADRKTAFEHVREASSLSEAVADIIRNCGQEPLLVATSARYETADKEELSCVEIRKALKKAPVLLLFGTGHGLAPEILDKCHFLAPPICWLNDYNHLSVRSAAVVYFDRILKDWH